MTKKILAIFLALLMATSVLSAEMFAMGGSVEVRLVANYGNFGKNVTIDKAGTYVFTLDNLNLDSLDGLSITEVESHDGGRDFALLQGVSTTTNYVKINGEEVKLVDGKEGVTTPMSPANYENKFNITYWNSGYEPQQCIVCPEGKVTSVEISITVADVSDGVSIPEAPKDTIFSVGQIISEGEYSHWNTYSSDKKETFPKFLEAIVKEGSKLVIKVSNMPLTGWFSVSFNSTSLTTELSEDKTTITIDGAEVAKLIKTGAEDKNELICNFNGMRTGENNDGYAPTHGILFAVTAPGTEEEPDEGEKLEKPSTLYAYVGNESDMGGGAQATVVVDAYSTFKAKAEGTLNKKWIAVKSDASVTGETTAAELPAGTVIKTTMKINGQDVTFDGGNAVFEYTVPESKIINIQYVNPYSGDAKHIDGWDAIESISSVEITLEIVKAAESEPDDVVPEKVLGQTAFDSDGSFTVDVGDPVANGETITLIMSGKTTGMLRAFIGSGSNAHGTVRENMVDGEFVDFATDFTSDSDDTSVHFITIKRADYQKHDLTLDSVWIYRGTKDEFDAWHAKNPEWTSKVETEDPDPDVEPVLVAENVKIDTGVGQVVVELPEAVTEGDTVTLIINGTAGSALRGYLSSANGTGMSNNTQTQFVTESGDMKNVLAEYTAEESNNADGEKMHNPKHYTIKPVGASNLDDTKITSIYIFAGNKVATKAWLAAHPDFPTTTEPEPDDPDVPGDENDVTVIFENKSLSKGFNALIDGSDTETLNNFLDLIAKEGAVIELTTDIKESDFENKWFQIGAQYRGMVGEDNWPTSLEPGCEMDFSSGTLVATLAGADFLKELNAKNWPDTKINVVSNGAPVDFKGTLVVKTPKSTEPEPDDPDVPGEVLANMGIYVGTWDANASVDVTKTDTEYTITYEKDAAETFDWLMLKSTASGEKTTLPAGTVVETTKLVIDGKEYKIDSDDISKYVVGDDQRIEIKYYLNPSYSGENHITDRPETGKKFEITFKIITKDAPKPDDPVDPDPGKPDEPSYGDVQIKLTDANVKSQGDTTFTVKDGVITGSGNMIAIMLPSSPQFKNGDTVKVHIVGSTKNQLRAYIGANAAWNNNASTPIVLADSGDFDKIYEFQIDTEKNNKCAIEAIILKGPAGGVMEGVTISYVGLILPEPEKVEDKVIFELEKVSTKNNYEGDPIKGYTISDGWCDTLITQYQYADVMAKFIAASKQDGAKLVITYKGDAALSLIYQVYEEFRWIAITNGVAGTDGEFKTMTFDCAEIIKTLESTPIKDGSEELCKFARLVNFSVGGQKNVLESIKIIIPGTKEEPSTAKKDNNFTLGYAVNLGPKYHGLFVNGMIITLVHEYDDEGHCMMCGATDPDFGKEEDVEESDESEEDGDSLVDIEVEE